MMEDLWTLRFIGGPWDGKPMGRPVTVPKSYEVGELAPPHNAIGTYHLVRGDGISEQHVYEWKCAKPRTMKQDDAAGCCEMASRHVFWETTSFNDRIPEKDGDGWHMSVEKSEPWWDDRTKYVRVRHCPFCGKEFTAEGELR